MKGNIQAYLNFPGSTREAFTFYQSIFGGELELMKFSDMPMEGMEVEKADMGKTMHACLTFGERNCIMASDSLESAGKKLQMGNNFYLYVPAESKEEADRIFGKLEKGGKVEMPMNDVPWGAYFGMLVDKFGIQWMISFSSHD